VADLEISWEKLIPVLFSTVIMTVTERAFACLLLRISSHVFLQIFLFTDKVSILGKGRCFRMFWNLTFWKKIINVHLTFLLSEMVVYKALLIARAYQVKVCEITNLKKIDVKLN
jgi:hypothetical protein